MRKLSLGAHETEGSSSARAAADTKRAIEEAKLEMAELEPELAAAQQQERGARCRCTSSKSKSTSSSPDSMQHQPGGSGSGSGNTSERTAAVVSATDLSGGAAMARGTTDV